MGSLDIAREILPMRLISIGYIPGQWDIRPVISGRRGQCVTGAEEVPRAKPEAERKHWPLPRDVTGLTSRWPGIQLTYTMLRLF